MESQIEELDDPLPLDEAVCLEICKLIDEGREVSEMSKQKTEDKISSPATLFSSDIDTENCSLDLTSLEVVTLGYELLEAPEIDEIIRYNFEFKPGKELPVVIAGPHFRQNIALDLMNKFRLQSPDAQGMIVIGVSACILVVGYSSWPLIAWVWPKIVVCANKIEVTLCASWVQRFVKTKAYKQFVVAWEMGHPLTPTMIQSFGPEMVDYITSFVPEFLKVPPKVMLKLQKLRASISK